MPRTLTMKVTAATLGLLSPARRNRPVPACKAKCPLQEKATGNAVFRRGVKKSQHRWGSLAQPTCPTPRREAALRPSSLAAGAAHQACNPRRCAGRQLTKKNARWTLHMDRGSSGASFDIGLPSGHY